MVFVDIADGERRIWLKCVITAGDEHVIRVGVLLPEHPFLLRPQRMSAAQRPIGITPRPMILLVGISQLVIDHLRKEPAVARVSAYPPMPPPFPPLSPPPRPGNLMSMMSLALCAAFGGSCGPFPFPFPLAADCCCACRPRCALAVPTPMVRSPATPAPRITVRRVARIVSVSISSPVWFWSSPMATYLY
ncbi:hypothetical protein AArc1_2167 [Natrarchaeobaculum sulfurireducens]|uniref:Uncharacterized protein n=1 Tax=Natrarchaeobaculum sulfurireducens TaxID=2044521 RepID=A0A346PG38_9EURY|nr:hypothetical protein AArc1_2167 [Natrarchaeobaculum sulfurireducens]